VEGTALAGPHRRPPIAAISDDGRRLTELGPGDHLDSHDWADIQAALEGD
jgi:hypothetical protein